MLDPSVVPVVDKFGKVEVGTFKVVSVSVVEVGTVLDNIDVLVSFTPVLFSIVTNKGVKL